jgi:hypothetical protein
VPFFRDDPGVIVRWLTKRSRTRNPTPDDEVLDSYVSWRAACARVRIAYESWSSSRSALAFDGYLAALDWEEQAANIHYDRTQRQRA